MKLSKKSIVKNLDDLKEIASAFIDTLTPLEQRATIVALKGNLGAGKTTFTQQVAHYLEVKEIVTSPTFVLEKIYRLNHKKFDFLIHIDAYRLESSRELEVLGWREIIENPKNLIMLEWPERVQEILPENMQIISLTFIDETTREITIN
ncbi:tRNA (adenosine(37)-N6)-threonylcarbamoyltransferase complex ATPase subunit type 1 TsaE [Patescibacteria group bacterium]|nr:tRNA (adenosine(37)-N6)-threonylcarbamoyltransferase complex ATPase subunit type 1 TsaE [Patescibacteria group bacterium]